MGSAIGLVAVRWTRPQRASANNGLGLEGRRDTSPTRRSWLPSSMTNNPGREDANDGNVPSVRTSAIDDHTGGGEAGKAGQEDQGGLARTFLRREACRDADVASRKDVVG